MSRFSPALRHQRQVLARLAAAATPHGEPVQGSAYEVTLAQLIEHRRVLHDIKSVERKIDAKRAFLPAYDPWIDGVLQAGQGAQDEVLTTVMVWHIDAGNYLRALQIARYVMQHGLQLPDRYERNAATVLIDEFGAAALAGRMTHALALEVLPEVLQLTAEHDVHDQARAKLHKAVGYALIGKSGSADVDLSAITEPVGRRALEHLQRALALFDQVGVKKDVERLERKLKASAPPAPPAPPPDTGPAAPGAPAATDMAPPSA